MPNRQTARGPTCRGDQTTGPVEEKGGSNGQAEAASFVSPHVTRVGRIGNPSYSDLVCAGRGCTAGLMKSRSFSDRRDRCQPGLFVAQADPFPLAKGGKEVPPFAAPAQRRRQERGIVRGMSFHQPSVRLPDPRQARQTLVARYSQSVLQDLPGHRLTIPAPEHRA